MAFFAIFVSFVVNTTVLDRQRPAGLREALRSSHESVHATIPIPPSIFTTSAKRASLGPDMPAASTFKDYISGIDPALEVISKQGA